MSTCPECGADVPDAADVCAACGARLGKGEGEGSECPNCGAAIPADSEACPGCGQLQQSAATCAMHPDLQARGACVICGRALCDECNEGSGAEYMCEEHSGVPLTEGWAQVYTTGNDLEAELIRDNLLAEGIDLQVLSQKDHFSFTMDIGDVVQVRVLVPAYEYEEAMRVLAAHADSMRQLAMACPSCDAPYEAGATTCGVCGESLVESSGA